MNDLISRQAVLDLIYLRWQRTEHGREYGELCIDELKALQSVEPTICPCTAEYQRVYMKGWNEGRQKLVQAMEKETAI